MSDFRETCTRCGRETPPFIMDPAARGWLFKRGVVCPDCQTPEERRAWENVNGRASEPPRNPLVFDGFPSLTDAEAFAAHAWAEYGRRWRIFTAKAATLGADPIPVELTPPIVHIEKRSILQGDTMEEIDDEERLMREVVGFGGHHVDYRRIR
jgi:hypothetical protein